MKNKLYKVEEFHRGEWTPFMIRKDKERVQKTVRITEETAEVMNGDLKDTKIRYVLAKGKNKSEEEGESKTEVFENAYREGSLNAEQLDALTKAQIYDYAKEHGYKYNEDDKKSLLIEQVLKAEKAE